MTGYATRAEVETLAREVGEVAGKMAREVERQRRRIVDLEAAIDAVQAAALETALAVPRARPKRSRSPRRRKLHDVLAAAE